MKNKLKERNDKLCNELLFIFLQIYDSISAICGVITETKTEVSFVIIHSK